MYRHILVCIHIHKYTCIQAYILIYICAMSVYMHPEKKYVVYTKNTNSGYLQKVGKQPSLFSEY